MSDPLNDELLSLLAYYSDKPDEFVLWAFPWGEPGTELAKFPAPDPWQLELLRDIREGLISINQAIQLARTSGHGIGKSALVAMLIWWAVSTMPDTKGVVTANTENQLKTKTWVEVAKWHRLFIGRHLFKFTATAIFSADPEHEKTWRIDMVPWSERNTEAFAGMHNQGRRILVVFDEASAIPDVIWEVTEGALTDENTEIIWCVFGNPTRNKGRFYECFDRGKFAHRWRSRKIDSRSVAITNKSQLQRWVDDYGEDSDFVRVRVRGEFPGVDIESFISINDARASAERPSTNDNNPWPVVLGVDVARFGDDYSVIYPRQGHDARSREPEIYAKLDNVQLARKIVVAMDRYQASVVFVDETGMGGGVVDILRHMSINVVAVNFSAQPDGVNSESGVKYANKRAEIWGAMRDWLRTGLIHPFEVPGSDRTLVDEISDPQYGFNGRDAIQLEKKEDMRRRGVPSPNIADALACTFAFPMLAPPVDPFGKPLQEKAVQYDDYNPYQTGVYQ